MDLVKLKKKHSYKIEYDSFLYLYFYYHEFFWRSLIKKGLKLRIYNKFCLLKYKLKLLDKNEPYIIFLTAFINISPIIFPQKFWIGGAQRVLPFPLFLRKQVFLSITWVLSLCKKKRELNLNKMVDILLDSLYEKGELWRKKKDLYDLCIENRLFFKYYK